MSVKSDKYKLSPHVRQDKNNKKYRIDFKLVAQHSNYFFKHQLEFEGKEEIELEREGSNITT